MMHYYQLEISCASFPGHCSFCDGLSVLIYKHSMFLGEFFGAPGLLPLPCLPQTWSNTIHCIISIFFCTLYRGLKISFTSSKGTSGSPNNMDAHLRVLFFVAIDLHATPNKDFFTAVIAKSETSFLYLCIW